MNLASYAIGNTLCAIWKDRGDGSGHSHIRLAKSSDGAQRWTTSFVTSGTNDEAQPSISGDASGLHILYYVISPVADGTSALDVFVSNAADGSSAWRNLKREGRSITKRSRPRCIQRQSCCAASFGCSLDLEGGIRTARRPGAEREARYGELC